VITHELRQFVFPTVSCLWPGQGTRKQGAAMEEAEARKARLAAMRARAEGAGAAGGLLTPQMLGAAPALFSTGAASAHGPAPMAMAPGGFYTAMHTPTVNTPVVLESFSMGDRPHAPPQRPPQRPPFGGHQLPFNQPMGGMGARGRGDWHGPPGRGAFMGGMPGFQGPGPHRGAGNNGAGRFDPYGGGRGGGGSGDTGQAGRGGSVNTYRGGGRGGSGGGGGVGGGRGGRGGHTMGSHGSGALYKPSFVEDPWAALEAS
jgi:hypothetical protein